MKIYLVFLRGD